jgi:hypothetical protein
MGSTGCLTPTPIYSVAPRQRSNSIPSRRGKEESAFGVFFVRLGALEPKVRRTFGSFVVNFLSRCVIAHINIFSPGRALEGHLYVIHYNTINYVSYVMDHHPIFYHARLRKQFDNRGFLRY